MRSVTTHWSCVVVHPNPGGFEVTSYPVIDRPPVFAGADQVIVAVVSDTTTPVNVGASGTPSGTTVDCADTPPNVGALSESVTDAVTATA